MGASARQLVAIAVGLAFAVLMLSSSVLPDNSRISAADIDEYFATELRAPRSAAALEARYRLCRDHFWAIYI